MIILRVLNVVFLVLFLLAAALQYNDPDWYIWTPMWLAAAAACYFHLRNRPSWIVPAVVGAVAVGWAAAIGKHVIGKVGFSDLFQEVGMANPSIEYGREFYGLAIIAAWMIVLILASRRQASAA